MKPLLRLAPLAAAVACGSNPVFFSNSDFSGPTGLAIASIPQRDLLFVANQGSNELRAIILCSAPANQPTTCTGNEDGQFLPGPIRVFPASIIDVGERPLRLAGAGLIETDGSTPHGAVLVAGSDAAVRVVDAANLFAASRDNTVPFANPSDPAHPERTVTLPAAAVDVVAAQTPGQTVTAVVASQAPPGGSAALTVVVVSLGTDGIARAAATQRCTIGFVPVRLALIPGKLAQPGTLIDDLDANGVPKHVYVADGTPRGTPGGVGDGAVEVSIPNIPPITSGSIPACPVTRRIPASDPLDSPRLARPLRSLALSPAILDKNNVRAPAGNFMLAVTAPDASLCASRGVRTCPPSIAGAGVVCVEQGFKDCGGGRIVILANDPVAGQSAVLTAPGVGIDNPTSTKPFVAGPPMAPLRPPAPAREVAFMARATCPDPSTIPSGRTDLSPPCTSARIGVNTPGAIPTPVQAPTIGLASAEDGSTVFIDVLNRRFFNDLRDTTPISTIPFQVTPSTTPEQLILPSPGFPPTAFSLQPPGTAAGTAARGWINAGVTRQATFRAFWHVTLPGLESVSGPLSRSGTGTILLTLPNKDLTPWITSPELQLSAGDFVRVISFSPAANCLAFANTRLDLDIPIASVSPSVLELTPVTGLFDPDPSCFAPNGVGGTFAVHAGDKAGAWMVSIDDVHVLGRFPQNSQFVVTGPRLDYPLPVDPTNAFQDTFALSFTIKDPVPTFASTVFFFQTFDGTTLIAPNPVTGQPLFTVSSLRDLSGAGLPGFAGPILVYDSPRNPLDQIVFTAITGSNSLLKAIPGQYGVANATPASFVMYY